MCKIEQDGENCWSVWLACECCDDGWHWIATCMGENAEQRARDWSNITKGVE